ncbi:MAG: sigma-54-dependent Fis family transcriptional regulator, partial [Planctomycetes bacterium]|nr:sigma-54-dependent Fis family transcriptional regulator [Planctomycetota bacterium]
MIKKSSILVVDDDRIILDSLTGFLSMEGFETNGVETLSDAISQLQKQTYSLVITDINLLDGNGFELLDIIKKSYPQTVVIVITSYGTIVSAVEAIKRGAHDYLTKPIVDDDLRIAVEKALKQQSLISENESLRLQLKRKYSLENIISHNYKMAKIFELVEAVADTTTT